MCAVFVLVEDPLKKRKTWDYSKLKQAALGFFDDERTYMPKICTKVRGSASTATATLDESLWPGSDVIFQ